MGCDIHLHVEVRIDDEWLHYANPFVSRNYTLFGFMAGVRDSTVEPVAEPKGLPSDTTKVTRLDYEHNKEDWHTPSWLSTAEIVELQHRLYNYYYTVEDKSLKFEYDLNYMFNTYLFENGFTSWYEYPTSNVMNIQDVRFVFWFDN